MTVTLLANRHQVPPFGLEGGAPKALGIAWIEREDGTQDYLQSADLREVAAGDCIVVVTPGGGGFGTPTESSGLPC